MPEFAKGLQLTVTDRDELKQYIEQNAQDPAVLMENWGANSIPEAIYIAYYRDDTPSYYKTYDKHVNETLSWNYWSEPLLNGLLEAGILKNTNSYDTDLIDQQE